MSRLRPSRAPSLPTISGANRPRRSPLQKPNHASSYWKRETMPIRPDVGRPIIILEDFPSLEPEALYLLALTMAVDQTERLEHDFSPTLIRTPGRLYDEAVYATGQRRRVPLVRPHTEANMFRSARKDGQR